MVKKRKKNIKKKGNGKGFNRKAAKARRINASTGHETCTEQLSPFGGLLALIKFLDLVNFKEIFNAAYHKPSREPKLGHYLMMGKTWGQTLTLIIDFFLKRRSCSVLKLLTRDGFLFPFTNFEVLLNNLAQS